MPGIPFTDDEDSILRTALSAGIKVNDIALNPDFLERRTRDSIRQYMRRHKLADPERSTLAKQVKKFDDRGKTAFCEFLRTQGPKHTLQALRKKWNRQAHKAGLPKVTASRVDYYLRKILKVKLPQGEIKKLPEVKQKMSASACRRGEIVRKTTDDALAKNLAQLERLRTRLLRNDPDHPTLRCSECPRTWPLTFPFYLERLGPSGARYLSKERCGHCQRIKDIEDGRNQSKPQQPLSSEELLQKRIRAKQRRSSRIFREGIQRASRRMKEILAAQLDTPLQGCCICPNTWPATAEFFKTNPVRGDGSYSLRPDCRWCQRSYQRRLELAALQGEDVAAIKADYRCALQKAYRLRSRTERDRRSIKAWEKEITLFIQRRTILQTADATIAMRECLRCKNSWPIVDYEFFPQQRLLGIFVDAHRRICRPCTKRHKRKLADYKRLGKSTVPLKSEIHRVICAARAKERGSEQSRSD